MLASALGPPLAVGKYSTVAINLNAQKCEKEERANKKFKPVTVFKSQRCFSVDIVATTALLDFWIQGTDEFTHSKKSYPEIRSSYIHTELNFTYAQTQSPPPKGYVTDFHFTP